ncbi:hypothetical protein ATANTOWER_017333 [Ataeniobius toweri]|uniref:Uncharacterized protein n=1 Tax=Ataeniobius toweri TaxID=208326 RepID=A0ABU7AK85_9TELE|nr:hypothetical protein [Ataeniobius toweri]
MGDLFEGAGASATCMPTAVCLTRESWAVSVNTTPQGQTAAVARGTTTEEPGVWAPTSRYPKELQIYAFPAIMDQWIEQMLHLSVLQIATKLGCVTTQCCAVKMAARATTISDATVPPASWVSCVRELDARVPESVMTSFLDGQRSIIPP